MALREAILQSLSCMLSANSDIRKVAEERMNALEVTDEYTNILLEIILTTDEALEERQMAGVVLKRYIKKHWIASSTEEQIISETAKEKMRTVLPMGLSDAQQKIRTLVAVSLSHIAQHDYPQNWPMMTELVKTKLQTNDNDQVDGIIAFLDACTLVLPVETMKLLVREVYDFFHNILQSELFSVTTRGRIINTTVHLLTLDHVLILPITDLIITIIQRFNVLLCRSLENPDSTESDVGFKSIILGALNQLLQKFPAYVMNTIPMVLPTIWDILHKCGSEYRKIIMSIEPVNDYNNEDAVHFEQLIKNIFSFIFTIVESNYMSSNIVHYLPDLIYWIILFQAITPTFERDWEEDELSFFNDDCDDLICNSIRTKLRSLISTILVDLDAKASREALSSAIDKHMKEAQLFKEQSYVYWWRISESIMFTLGNTSSEITKKHSEWLKTVTELLTDWSSILDSPAPLILHARVIWVGGRFTSLMTISCFMKHIDNITCNILASHHIIRISALRALSFHCSNFDRKSVHFHVFSNSCEALFERLLESTQTYSIAFATSADCIRYVINANPSCATIHSSRLTQFLTECILNNINDTTIVEKCLDVIKELSNNSFIVASLHRTLLHVFLSILVAPVNGKPDESEQQCHAIRIIKFLVIHSPKHLLEDLVQQGFPVVYRIVMTSKDPCIVEMGISCIQTYLAKGTEQVCRIRDIEGCTGLDCIRLLLKHVLAPQALELTSVIIAKYIIFALRAISECKEDVLDETIRALVSKIHISSIMHYEDSLVLVFAYLFYTNLESTTTILSTIPGPDGDSALKYIFIKWLNKHHNFFGKFEKNLSVVSFVKIMEYALSRNDETLLSIKVRVVNNMASEDDGLPNSGLEQLVCAKIFKLLIHVITREYELMAQHVLPDSSSFDTVMEAIDKPENDLEYIYKIQITNYLADVIPQIMQTLLFQHNVKFITKEDMSNLESIGLHPV